MLRICRKNASSESSDTYRHPAILLSSTAMYSACPANSILAYRPLEAISGNRAGAIASSEASNSAPSLP